MLRLTVCGFDDAECSRAVWPELTTIRQPTADMSRAVIMLLLKKIKARREGRQESLAIRELLATGVDGIILPPPLGDAKRIHEVLAKAGTVAVAVASTSPRPGMFAVRMRVGAGGGKIDVIAPIIHPISGPLISRRHANRDTDGSCGLQRAINFQHRLMSP